jgi:hypothetical protein
MNKKARELMDQLDQKYIELDKTRKQLDASLTIQMLWPDAFKHGKCTSYLQGNLFKAESMRFVIKDGNGGTKEFELIDIPNSLLERAIEFQKRKANPYHVKDLDKLYKSVQLRKRIKRKE